MLIVWSKIYLRNCLSAETYIGGKEENSLFDLSQDVRKSFSASKSFTTFSFILKDQLRWRILFCSKFCKIDKCFSGVDNRERKPLLFLYRTVIGLSD